MRRLTTALSLTAVLALGVQAATLEERVKALEEQNEVLTEEVLASQSDGFTLVDTEKSYNGMGVAASKVYFSKNPLSIGGYGEMYYANPEGKDDYADVYRFITYFGYRFNDWVILNAEIEFEHGANAEDGGEVVLEFMYLDFLLSQEVNIRLGHVLVPMGLINLRHEPILFNTVQRPEVEKLLIPSTWHENGALLYGKFESLDLEYTAGVINTLNMNNGYTIEGEPKWIREGRLGSSSKAPFDPAFVGRVDYTGVNGLMVGASVYYGGGSNLKDPSILDPIQDVSGLNSTIFDIHAMYDNGPFSAYGLYTQTTLDGASKLGAKAAKKASGYYGNVSYDLGDVVGIDYKLPLFAQYENLNPVNKTVSGLSDKRFQTDIITIGMNFFPVDQAVIKADYAMRKVHNHNQEDVFSFGIGFVF